MLSCLALVFWFSITLFVIVPHVFVCLQGVRIKNKLILRLMEQLVYPNPAAYRDILIRFSVLNHTNYSEVGLCIELLKHKQLTLRCICLCSTILECKESLFTLPWGEDFCFLLLVDLPLRHFAVIIVFFHLLE